MKEKKQTTNSKHVTNVPVASWNTHRSSITGCRFLSRSIETDRPEAGDFARVLVVRSNCYHKNVKQQL